MADLISGTRSKPPVGWFRPKMVQNSNRRPSADMIGFPDNVPNKNNDREQSLESVLREVIPEANITGFGIFNRGHDGAERNTDANASSQKSVPAEPAASAEDPTSSPTPKLTIRRTTPFNSGDDTRALVSIDSGSIETESRLLLEKLSVIPFLKESCRTIVLVGYGFGGVIIKQALLLANTLPQYHHIAVQTTDLVFIATPYKARNESHWRDQFVRVVNLGLQNKAAFSSSNSSAFETLQRISFRFKQYHSKRYKITNILENQGGKTGSLSTSISNIPIIENGKLAYSRRLSGASWHIDVPTTKTLINLATVDMEQIEDLEYLVQLQDCLGAFAVLGQDGSQIASLKAIHETRKVYLRALLALSSDGNLFSEAFPWEYGDSYLYDVKGLGEGAQGFITQTEAVQSCISNSMNEYSKMAAPNLNTGHQTSSQPASISTLLTGSSSALQVLSQQLQEWEFGARQSQNQGPTVVATSLAALQALNVSGVDFEIGGSELLLRVIIHQILSQQPEVFFQIEHEYSTFYTEFETLWTTPILWKLLRAVLSCLPKSHGLVLFFHDADKWFHTETAGVEFFDTLRTLAWSLEVGYILFHTTEFKSKASPLKPWAYASTYDSSRRQLDPILLSSQQSRLYYTRSSAVHTPKDDRREQILYAHVSYATRAGVALSENQTTGSHGGILQLECPLHGLFEQAGYDRIEIACDKLDGIPNSTIRSQIEESCITSTGFADSENLEGSSLSYGFGSLLFQSPGDPMLFYTTERLSAWACLARRPLSLSETYIAMAYTLLSLDEKPGPLVLSDPEKLIPDFSSTTGQLASSLHIPLFHLDPFVKLIDGCFLKAAPSRDFWSALERFRSTSNLKSTKTLLDYRETRSNLDSMPQLNDGEIARICILYLQNIQNPGLRAVFEALYDALPFKTRMMSRSSRRPHPARLGDAFGDVFAEYATKHWFAHYKASWRSEKIATTSTSNTNAAGSPSTVSDTQTDSDDPSTKSDCTSTQQAATTSTDYQPGDRILNGNEPHQVEAPYQGEDKANEELESNRTKLHLVPDETPPMPSSADQLDELVVSFLQNQESRQLWYSNFIRIEEVAQPQSARASHSYDPAMDRTGVEAASLLGLNKTVIQLLATTRAQVSNSEEDRAAHQLSFCRALEWACLNKHENVVNTLIALDGIGTSEALRFMAINNYAEAISKLLERWTREGSHMSIMTPGLQTKEALIWAAKAGSFEALKVLFGEIRSSASCVEEFDASNWDSLIRNSALGGNVKVFRFVYEAWRSSNAGSNGAPLPLYSVSDGLTLLMLASQLGHKDIAEFLVAEVKVDVSVLDRNGRNTIIHAIRADLAVMDLLLEHFQSEMAPINLNLKDIRRSPDIPYLVGYQLIYPVTIQRLLSKQYRLRKTLAAEAGPQPESTASAGFDHVFTISACEAVKFGNLELLQILQNLHGVKFVSDQAPEDYTTGRRPVDLNNTRGYPSEWVPETPIHIAANMGYYGIIKYFFDSSNSPGTTPDQSVQVARMQMRAAWNQTAVVKTTSIRLFSSEVAAASGLVSSVKLFLDSTNLSSQTLNASYGELLCCAATHWQSASGYLLARYLLAKGASLTAKLPTARFPLDESVKDVCDSFTPLILATFRKSRRLIALFLPDESKVSDRRILESVLACDSKRKTVLHYAVESGVGAEQILVQLLENPTLRKKINRGDIYHRTALHLASRNPTLTKLLLDAGASVAVIDQWDRTPVYFALRLDSSWGDTEDSTSYWQRPEVTSSTDAATRIDRGCDRAAFRLLIEKEMESLPLDSSSEDEKFAAIQSQFGPLFTSAAKVGDLEALDVLCEEFPGLVTTKTESGKVQNSQPGNKALRAAVKRDFVGVVRVLAKHGIVIDEENYGHGGTQLHRAVEECRVEMVRALVAAGADLEKEEGKDDLKTRRTPLYIACFKGWVECAKVLLELGADVKKYCHGGVLPLHVIPDQPKFISLMVEKGGPEILEAKTQLEVPGNRRRLLMEASLNGFVKVVEELVVQRQVDVNAGDFQRRTALHYAVMCRENDVGKQILGLLLKAKADYNAVDNTGYTPIALAEFLGSQKAGHIELLKKFQELDIRTIEKLDQKCMEEANKVSLTDQSNLKASLATTQKAAHDKCSIFSTGELATKLPQVVEAWSRQRLGTQEYTHWTGTFTGKIPAKSGGVTTSSASASGGEEETKFSIAGESETMQTLSIQLKLALKTTQLPVKPPNDANNESSTTTIDPAKDTTSSQPFSFSLNGFIVFEEHQGFVLDGGTSTYRFQKKPTTTTKPAGETASAKEDPVASTSIKGDSEGHDQPPTTSNNENTSAPAVVENAAMEPDPRGWDAVKGSIDSLFWTEFQFRLLPTKEFEFGGADTLFCSAVFKGGRNGEQETVEPVDRIEGTWDMRNNWYYRRILQDAMFTLTRDKSETILVDSGEPISG